MPSLTSRPGPRGERVALAAALVWGAALMVGAAVAPAYETETGSSSGAVGHGSATLVEANGAGVLLVVAVPLVAAAIVSLALWRRPADRGAGPVAWTCVGVLGGFNLLAMLTIGVFIVPVTVCLFIVCVRRQAHSRVPPTQDSVARLT